MNNKSSNQKYALCFFSAVATMICTILVISVLSFVPNVLDETFINNNFVYSIDNFVAETSEKMQYIFGTICFPLFYLGFYYLFSRFGLNNKALNGINKLQNSINYVLLFLAIAFFVVPNSSVRFYFGSLLSKVNYYLLTLFIVGIICAIIKAKHLNKIGSAILFLMAVLNIVWIAKLYITNTYFYNVYFVEHHFDAYFYPVYKTYVGLTPTIDFSNLYGFYSYFLTPIFKLFGGITMYKFSILMAFLSAITLLNTTIFLFAFCKNKIIALLGSVCMGFIWFVWPMLYQGDYYLQYFPHRVLFYSFLLVLITAIVKAKNKKTKTALIILTYFIGAFALLWNLESGIVYLLLFFLFNCFCNLLRYKLNDKNLYINIMWHFVYLLLSVLVSVVSLVTITYCRTGILIDVQEAFLGASVFYKNGFYAIKLSLFHPWVFLVLLYGLSLIKSLRSIVDFQRNEGYKEDKFNYINFILPVLGMGVFLYYQGRSHDIVFLLVIWPAVLMLTCLLDHYAYEVMETKAINTNRILIGIKCFFIIVLMSAFAMCYIVNMSSDLFAKNIHKPNTDNNITKTFEVMCSIGDPKSETIDLISKYADEVYSNYKLNYSPPIPACVDWLTRNDTDKVINYIKNNNNKIIMDDENYNVLVNMYGSTFTEMMNTDYSKLFETDGYIAFQKTTNN